MATVYSLVCWGGLTGKVVSISASTDVVTLTNHGLRNGAKLWPSGTLPSELNTSTPVYARSTGTNTFTLHTSAAGAIANTGQILFAGSSTYAAVTLKSNLVADPSTALSAYGLSDLSRWGSTRIYDGLNSFSSARSTASVVEDHEICEIGEDFTELYTANLSFGFNSSRTTVWTKINGIRTPAFHNFVYGTGFHATKTSGTSAISMVGLNTICDGFTAKNTVSNSSGLALSNVGTTARNMFVVPGANSSNIAISLSAMTSAINCVVIGGARGITVGQAQLGVLAANNFVTGCSQGFGHTGGATTAINGSFYNNIAIGNTTNWAAVTGFTASHNAGESGNSPWDTVGGTSQIVSSSDFANYAGYDVRPASATSPQVENGRQYFEAYAYDGLDAERPNYLGTDAGTDITAGSFVSGLRYTIATVGTTDFTLIGASANTVGVSFRATGAGSGTGTATLTERFDIGPVEYDHGYGPHPASHTLTLANVVVGSRVHIRDQADTVTHYDDIAAASSVVIPITVYGDTRDNWRIKVRKASAAPYYQPWETIMTATAGASSIYVSQIPD